MHLKIRNFIVLDFTLRALLSFRIIYRRWSCEFAVSSIKSEGDLRIVSSKEKKTPPEGQEVWIDSVRRERGWRRECRGDVERSAGARNAFKWTVELPIRGGERAPIANWLARVVANKNSITLQLLSKSSDGPFSVPRPPPSPHHPPAPRSSPAPNYDPIFLFVRRHSLEKILDAIAHRELAADVGYPDFPLSFTLFAALALAPSGANWSTDDYPRVPSPLRRVCGRTLRAHLYSRPFTAVFLCTN